MIEPDLGLQTLNTEDPDYKAVEANLDTANGALQSTIRAISHIDALTPGSRASDVEYFTAIAFERVIAGMANGDYGIGVDTITAEGTRRVDPHRKLCPALRFETEIKGKHLLGIEKGELLGYPELNGSWFLIFSDLAGEICLAPIDKIKTATLRVVRQKEAKNHQLTLPTPS